MPVAYVRMCGIIAVLQRRPTRRPPDLDRIVDELGVLTDRLRAAEGERDLAGLGGVAGQLEAIDAELRGPPGAAALLAAAGLGGADRLEAAGDGSRRSAGLEAGLDAAPAVWRPDELEAVNAVVVRLKDVAWALTRDRPDTAPRE